MSVLGTEYEYRRAGSGLEGAQAGGHIIRRQAVTAVDAIEIRDAYAAIAVTTSCGDLVSALRAEMEIDVDACAARRAK
jgi:hypothetical protein